MEFRDLKKQYEVLKTGINRAISDVLSSSHFISGPQVGELEEQLAEYVGVKHCITCANGTDALSLALKAWGIGKGDAIFVPDFTYFATGEVVSLAGATPVFVDIAPSTYNIDPNRLEEAILATEKTGQYRLRAVIAVDLFGLPADYDRIKQICNKYNLLLLEDGAQGFGGRIRGKKACSFGDIATTSFFPAKPLGCYGDGGAVFTDNDEWAALIKSYAVHGKGKDKYDNVRIGMNSRLDTIQAAILQVKLEAFRKRELVDANRVAGWYMKTLKNSVLILPEIPESYLSSWAQFTIRLPEKCNRTKLQNELKANGIPTMVYYEKPMHLQKAFQINDTATNCPVAESICKTVLNLPFSPYMNKEMTEHISEELLRKC